MTLFIGLNDLYNNDPLFFNHIQKRRELGETGLNTKMSWNDADV